MIEYENLSLVNKPYEKDFKSKFEQVLNKGWFVLGSEVEDFENEFATYCGSKFCIGVASGLDALFLSLLVLELPKDSEVLVPSNTYIATILAIIQAGFKPVLVEPDLSTYNIDPDLIREKINSKTKIILVVHLFGKPCDMERITKIAAENNLVIIEDCAQAHGALSSNKRVGSWGLFGAFSFYPTKNLGALGDGGAITTDNEDLANKLKAFRNYGSQKKYYNDYIGLNSRLDELQAAFLRIKLKQLDTINLHKQKLAEVYFSNLPEGKLILPIKSVNETHVFHIYNVRSPERDRLKEYLLKKGIKTEIHYPIPPHKQTAYKTFFKNQRFPLSEEMHQTTLSLPVSTCHSADDILVVTEAINHFFSS
jgi:dTDP-4-amino-4,6-dideoxygalactose transaminase